MNPVFAFQPWENGIFPLKAQLRKIDEALSFNFDDLQAEYQTESKRLALLSERDALDLQRQELERQIEASEKLHHSGAAYYLVPSGGSSDLSSQAVSQASR